MANLLTFGDTVEFVAVIGDNDDAIYIRTRKNIIYVYMGRERLQNKRGA